VPRCSPAANVQPLISSTGATAAETMPHHGTPGMAGVAGTSEDTVPLAADIVPLAASRRARPGRPGEGMAAWRVLSIVWHVMGTSPPAPGGQKLAGCEQVTHHDLPC
jgi:hypothetical protein